MTFRDTVRFSSRALSASPGRTVLILLAMVIGIASVILLTSLGEGARRYVVGQFHSLGSNLLLVLPGRTETKGGMPPMFGYAPHDLTLEDCKALEQSPLIDRAVPIVFGTGDLSYGGRERQVSVIGTDSGYQKVFNLSLVRGQFLPSGDRDRAEPVCVLGEELYRKVFGHEEVLGHWVRIGTHRFRLIGVLKSKGKTATFDMSNMVLIPTVSAQSLFDRSGLFQIAIQARNKAFSRVQKRILSIIQTRHNGEKDITVIRQDAMVSSLDEILQTLTIAVGGIGAISLLVAGILIMNVMMVSVSQRRSEIGLLMALGASTREVMRLFLSEALMLSLVGGVLGLVLGLGAVQLIGWLVPVFPILTPWWAIVAALVVALATGLIFGSVPARQAARLHPVAALSGR